MPAQSILRSMRRLFSVSIFFKTLGIGVLVGLIFGLTIHLQIRRVSESILVETMGQKLVTQMQNLALELESMHEPRQLPRMAGKLDQFIQSWGDGTLFAVRSINGEVLAHYPSEMDFPDEALPLDLNFRHDDETRGPYLDAAYPMTLSGHTYYLHLFTPSQHVHTQVDKITRSLFPALALASSLGLILALALSRALTRPIYALKAAAQRLTQGDFSARAEIIDNDEIGSLTGTFNSMAASLQNYDRTVTEKEHALSALISKMTGIQENERQVISRELHDQLGQSLSSLLLALRSRKELAEETLQFLETKILLLIDSVRRIAWSMRPAILDDYGIETALKRYLEEMSSVSNIQMEFETLTDTSQTRLSPEVETTLYRVAQEAVTNVIRHAHAAQVSVLLRRDRGQVLLLVEDDGRGFDAPEVARRGNSLGLLSIRERLALLNGELTLESKPGHGTLLKASIPLKGDTGHD